MQVNACVFQHQNVSRALCPHAWYLNHVFFLDIHVYLYILDETCMYVARLINDTVSIADIDYQDISNFPMQDSQPNYYGIV